MQQLTRTITVFTLIALSVFLMAGSTARAAQAPVGLGTADSFAVLASSTVTNTGPTVVNGNLGVHPGSSVTGFPPGTVNGTIHAGDATAAQAQSDLTIAYNDAAGRACDVNLTGQDLGGKTLTAAAYCFSTAAQLTGAVTLNGQGDPNAVFIFQIGSTLTTASASSVNLINGAQSCNVFWQIGSSATLGTNTAFRGNILALQSITLNTSATIVDGRALARNGAVTLDSNTITRATCAASPSPSPTASPSPSPSPTASPSPSPTSSPGPTPSPAASPSPSPTSSPGPTPSPAASPPGGSPAPRPGGGPVTTGGGGATGTEGPSAPGPGATSGTPGVEGETAARTGGPAVVGPPGTGGAPLQSGSYPWLLVLVVSVIGGLGGVAIARWSRA